MKAVHDRLYGEIIALEEELAATRRLMATLFEAIAHGSPEHRRWLKEAIDNHCTGKPVPETYD